MLFNLNELPDSIKLETTKGDLIAFAEHLVQSFRSSLPSPKEDKEILTIDEAVEITHLSKQTIYGFTSRKCIPHFKHGKKVLFRRSELENWMLAQPQKTTIEEKNDLVFIPKFMTR
jgi:excisionase family DNA binding protein